WQIMKLLWRRSPQTAQELVRELAASWSESTVKTLLNRLVRKGALRHEKEGKAFWYSPAVTEAECRAAESATFLNRVFDGALSPMLAHFVESSSLNDEELAELERLVRRKRRGS
ncbi:MAG TPA: BlaI/MecI/CopY family transcriptional regulator, partial [Chthoniobacterales bacterium]